MRLFRLHIRPGGGLGDPKLSFAHCLKNGVLGMGWGIDVEAGRELSWEEYAELASRKFGGSAISRVRYLKTNVKAGHLIWTRDTRGKYYLARVRSPWRYDASAIARDADMVNVVDCELQEVPHVDQVPGKVIASFRPSRTIQAITKPVAVQYSMLFWNQLVDDDVYAVQRPTTQDLFDFLDDQATEDVVFVYLQLRGWLVVPMSRRADTMTYEWILIHRETRERAVVQVKTGKSPVDLSLLSEIGEKVFVFQSNGVFAGTATSDIETIEPRDLLDFAVESRELLPRSVGSWLDNLSDDSL